MLDQCARFTVFSLFYAVAFEEFVLLRLTHTRCGFRPARWAHGLLPLLMLTLPNFGQSLEGAEGSAARLIRVPLPITGAVDDQVKRKIDQALNAFSNHEPRPILVLEFWTADEVGGQGSQFERSFALARYLTSDRVRHVRTVAYLPQSLTGHAVLATLACEEIVMHPEAELGEAGIDDNTIDPTIRSAYREIADRARTIPSSVALGMLDRRLETFQVETPGGNRYVLADELDQLKQETAISSIDTIIPTGEMGKFTGRELRLQYGWVSRLAKDRTELASALELPGERLLVTPSTNDGQWKPVQIKITGAINASTRLRVQRGIEDFRKTQDVNFICLWLDSPGGSPADSLSLAHYLADLADSQIRTVAYIPAEARADAALIAFACDETVMHKNALMGGSGVYQMDPQQIQDVRTALSAELAVKKSASWSLPAAMLDPELSVREYQLRGRSITKYFCAEELAEQSDPDRWKPGAEESAQGELYVSHADQAERVGLATHVVGSFDQFKQLYHLTDDPTLVEPGWAQQLVAALASPELAATLLFVASFALFFEFSSPGLGIGGFVSLLCFLLFFWSQFLQGTAGWLEVLLFAGGISCVILEIFVIPGFGIFGLGGGAMIITSLVLASQTVLQIPQNEYQITELRNSLLTISAAGAGLAVSVFLARKYAHQMPLLKNVLLIPPAGDDLDELVYRESLVDFSYLLGQDGTTTTKLTPAGKARFAEELIDVVSQGELLPANTTVQVVEVHGNRVVVARVI
ncbi:MAG: hypothetical protein CMJ81_16155 [Planctomycetaceae bacterium]|nr:hypothetical protein [Planctomycetaceae bacterium]MBP63808.1 hypothetical protein [Planctomycetaceae bacterium]